jgi:hypothetical protein
MTHGDGGRNENSLRCPDTDMNIKVQRACRLETGSNQYRTYCAIIMMELSLLTDPLSIPQIIHE